MGSNITSLLDESLQRIQQLQERLEKVTGRKDKGLGQLHWIEETLERSEAPNLEALQDKLVAIERKHERFVKRVGNLADSADIEQSAEEDRLSKERLGKLEKWIKAQHELEDELARFAPESRAVDSLRCLIDLSVEVTRALAGGATDPDGTVGQEVTTRFQRHIEHLNRLAKLADSGEFGEPLARIEGRLELADKQAGELEITRQRERTTQGQLDDVRSVLSQLAAGESGESPQLARSVVERVERAVSTMRQVLGTSEDDLEELTSKLVASHRNQGAEIESWRCRLQEEQKGWSRELTEVRRYLGFADPDESGEFRQPLPLEREIALDWRELRLSVCAALARWPDSSAMPGEESRHLVEALALATIEERMRRFLQRLETYSDNDELWEQGLAKAFGAQWLHDLLRARLLLDTYYAPSSVARQVFQPVLLAAAAFRRLLSRLGRQVEDVELLAPFPEERPEGWDEPLYHADGALHGLSTVRGRILRELDSRDGFIVDVRNFRLNGDATLRGSCKVVVVSPGDWRQA